MELVLTDKGRMELESGTLEDDQSTWHMGRWLIGIDQGVIGSGDNSFNNWDEFKVWYGEFGVDALKFETLKQPFENLNNSIKSA